MAQGPSVTILVAIWITLRIRESKSEIRILRIGGGLFSVSAFLLWNCYSCTDKRSVSWLGHEERLLGRRTAQNDRSQTSAHLSSLLESDRWLKPEFTSRRRRQPTTPVSQSASMLLLLIYFIKTVTNYLYVSITNLLLYFNSVSELYLAVNPDWFYLPALSFLVSAHEYMNEWMSIGSAYTSLKRLRLWWTHRHTDPLRQDVCRNRPHIHSAYDAT